MNRTPVYICAPYAPSHLSVEENVRRACSLAHYAAMGGFAPIVVHPAILPVYGSDKPKNRSIGLEVDVALVKLVAGHPRGQIWILTPDDDGLSEGMLVEFQAWLDTVGSRGVKEGRWDWWQKCGVKSTHSSSEASASVTDHASDQDGPYTLKQISEMLTQEGFENYTVDYSNMRRIGHDYPDAIVIGAPEDHAGCSGPITCEGCDGGCNVLVTLRLRPPGSTKANYPKPIHIGWGLSPDRNVDFEEAVTIIRDQWVRPRRAIR